MIMQEGQRRLPHAENPIPKNEAMMQILQIEQQAMAMGANDYEPAAFMAIKTKLREGKITATEAVTQARGILDSKQDYH